MTVTLNLTEAEAETLSVELGSIIDMNGWNDIPDADPAEIEAKIRRQL